MQQLTKIILFALFAVFLGLGSMWSMITTGTGLSVLTVGPWQSWTTQGHPDTDPYTRAHIMRSGRLPITSTGARYFMARTDSGNDPLFASCEYELRGRSIDALWWSIALYDEEGQIIPNSAERYAFNSANMFFRDDGTYSVRIAQRARPENWLPISGDRPLVLMLRIYRPRFPNEFASEEAAAQLLPTINQVTC